jgi:small subunit ribosomal protein S1
MSHPAETLETSQQTAHSPDESEKSAAQINPAGETPAALASPAEPTGETLPDPQVAAPVSDTATASPSDEPGPSPGPGELERPEAQQAQTQQDQTQQDQTQQTQTPPLESPQLETPTPETRQSEPAQSEPAQSEPAQTEPAQASSPDAVEAAPESAATGGEEAAETDATANAVVTVAGAEVAEDNSSGGAESSGSADASTEPRPELLPLIAAMNNGEMVNGKVIGWNKGGFHVVLQGVPAFCPKSQIELGNPRRANVYIDKSFDFKITEIRDGGKRVVVSRKPVLKEQRSATVERLRQAKVNGETLVGRISSITEFGAFVDIGGVEGLVHLSQLSRKRVEKVQDVAQLGQEVEVKVLKIEKGGERVSLSMRAMEPDPWESLGERWTPGAPFTGTVARRADFGLFVEIEDGVEGLVHESTLPHGTSLTADTFAEGRAIGGWIKEIDPRRKRLSLSLREVAQNNPWQNVLDRYPEGARVNATVEQVAKFGVFAELEPGLTGLLPISSLNLPTGVRVDRQFRPGQVLDVVIDSVDAKRKRISLAPIGSQLEGTKSDLKTFQRQQQETRTGLNAMRAAFEKLGLDADA